MPEQLPDAVGIRCTSNSIACACILPTGTAGRRAAGGVSCWLSCKWRLTKAILLMQRIQWSATPQCWQLYKHRVEDSSCLEEVKGSRKVQWLPLVVQQLRKLLELIWLCRHAENKFSPIPVNSSVLLLAWNALTVILHASTRSLQTVLVSVNSSMPATGFQNDTRVFLCGGRGEIFSYPELGHQNLMQGRAGNISPPLVSQYGLGHHVSRQNIWTGVYLRSHAMGHVFIIFTDLIFRPLCPLDTYWVRLGSKVTLKIWARVMGPVTFREQHLVSYWSTQLGTAVFPVMVRLESMLWQLGKK